MSENAKKTILFVCMGNTCRSPFAQGLFNRLAAEQGLNYRALSAGLSAFPGDAANQNTLALAEDYGFDLSDHGAQRMNEQLIQEAERVYAMEQSQADALKAGYPGLAPKVFALAEEDIPDPYGAPLVEYAKMAVEIERAVRAIIAELAEGSK